MTPSGIRAALKRRQIKIIDLARQHNISNAVIHKAISGIGRSAKAEHVVAQALGKDRLTLFGPNFVERRRATSAPESNSPLAD